MNKILSIAIGFILFSACSPNKNVPIISEDYNFVKEKEKIENKIHKVTNYEYDFNMLMGHFDPAQHQDYVLIDTQYADRSGLYLHKDTYEAFKLMYAEALKKDIKLIIRSATRNFDNQKNIWENKWNGVTKVGGEDISKTIPDANLRALKILEYSSMPGTSRHHWGSDIDMNSFDNTWFEQGEGKKMLDWLEENAITFGFCRPYIAKNEIRPEGYNEERWHWSYLPLATYFTNLAKEKHSDDKIIGFKGSEVARELHIVEKYVFGINKECLIIHN